MNEFIVVESGERLSEGFRMLSDNYEPPLDTEPDYYGNYYKSQIPTNFLMTNYLDSNQWWEGKIGWPKELFETNFLMRHKK